MITISLFCLLRKFRARESRTSVGVFPRRRPSSRIETGRNSSTVASLIGGIHRLMNSYGRTAGDRASLIWMARDGAATSA
jgi:hypothetical protein